jgi:integrase
LTASRKTNRKPRGRRSNHEGTMTLRKDGRWQIAFTTGRTADGKAQRIYRYAATEDEAKTIRTEMAYQHSRGELAVPEAGSLDLLAQRWLSIKRIAVQPRTHHSYTQILKSHVLPVIGDVPFRKLTRSHIEGLLVRLDERDLGYRTMKLVLWIVSTILEYAVEHGLLSKNPARSLKVPKRPPPSQRRPWTAEQATRFLVAAKGDRLYPAFYLMLVLGLRRGELLGLKWEDVDVRDRSLRIANTLLKAVGGGLEFGDPKTPKSRRQVHLADDAIELLEVHRERQRAERRRAAELWKEHGLVFATAVGTPVHPDNLKRVLQRVCRIAGVPVIRIHDLRHTHASLALQCGTDDKVLSERLGHTNVAFTRSVYQHTYEEQHRKAALKMQALLGPGSETQLLSD